MQTKSDNNSKRYIYRKNALGRDKSVMGHMTGAVKNYIKGIQKYCKTNCDKTCCTKYEEV